MGIFSELRVPVISAPMAGGINNPLMAAAVIKAGGVGSFGFAYSTPNKIEADLSATISLCGEKPPLINANFFVFNQIELPDQEQIDLAKANLKDLTRISIPDFPVIKEPYFPNLDDQLESIWKVKPKFLTFHFGIPDQKIINKARSLGIRVGITATSEKEALAIQRAGADFIVAQGIEAGGHRGIFQIDDLDECLSSFELLARLKNLIQLPVALAGGIMTPSDVKRAINAGASVVQMGSAFLTTKESSASLAHKRFLLTQGARGTSYTKAFSGRWAQGINNRFILEMDGKFTLPFPLQNTITSGIRQEAINLDDGEHQSLWCGSRYALCKDVSVHELMLSIEQELLN